METADWIKVEGKKVQAIETEIAFVRRGIEEDEDELAEMELELIESSQAQDILSGIAKSVQQEAHQRISSVVSSCLRAVFEDEAYEFKIEFEQKRGRTEAKLLFVRDGLEVDPLKAAGGGAVDVAAFALRAACLVMHRPRLRKLLVLDEPFKFVSREYRSRVREMLESLAEDLKLQIILVTHDDELKIGEVIEL